MIDGGMIGPIIDEAAPIAALQAKEIAGAGLDVFQVEPLQADNPLLGLDNVVLTPHQGYVTRENYGNFFAAAVANVRSWLDGKLINELDIPHELIHDCLAIADQHLYLTTQSGLLICIGSN